MDDDEMVIRLRQLLQEVDMETTTGTEDLIHSRKHRARTIAALGLE